MRREGAASIDATYKCMSECVDACLLRITQATQSAQPRAPAHTCTMRLQTTWCLRSVDRCDLPTAARAAA
eukprot:11980435-Alexandrium_andersonii.AAC.1